MVQLTKHPHFFRLHSRLGLPNPPLGSKAVITGVEEGPSAVLSDVFVTSFTQARVESYTFPHPEEVNADVYIETIVTSARECSQMIAQRWSSRSTQVCVGGDHSITFSTLLALQERVDFAHMGLIQIDSHADMNLRATSPTGNFHGMYMRPFLSEMDIPEIGALVKQKLRYDQVWYWGNMDLDREEAVFMKQHGIAVFPADTLRIQSVMQRDLDVFMKSVSHIHVNIDIDAFDRTVAPATGIPAQKGLVLSDVFVYLKILSQFPSISIDLVEVNPTLAGAEKTVQLAQSILLTLLGR